MKSFFISVIIIDSTIAEGMEVRNQDPLAAAFINFHEVRLK